MTSKEHHKLESIGELHLPKFIDLYTEIQYSTLHKYTIIHCRNITFFFLIILEQWLNYKPVHQV